MPNVLFCILDGAESFMNCFNDSTGKKVVERPLLLDKDAGDGLWKPDLAFDRMVHFEKKAALDQLGGVQVTHDK